MFDQERKMSMGKSENLHKGHRDRVRQRFLTSGIESFYDHQILEMMLFYVIPRRDTNASAHYLLNKFGSLDKLLNASPQEWEENGVNSKTAQFLGIIHTLCKSYVDGRYFLCNPSQALISSEQIVRYTLPLLKESTKEYFLLLLPDPTGRCLLHSVVHYGSIANETNFIRNASLMAHRYGAAGIILVHYVPEEMSVDDESMDFVILLKKKFELVHTPLIDYIAIQQSEAYSMLHPYENIMENLKELEEAEEEKRTNTSVQEMEVFDDPDDIDSLVDWIPSED